MDDNWIVIQDNEGFAKIISERLFKLYMEKIDDNRVILKKFHINDDVDEETKKNDPHKFGDWSHLNAKITGYYKLVL